MPEWLIGTVSKTVFRLTAERGFESHPLRQKNKIFLSSFINIRGEVSERPNERAWKARIPTKSVSRVRLPPSPPVFLYLAVLDGELAVPCNLQPATAGSIAFWRTSDY